MKSIEIRIASVVLVALTVTSLGCNKTASTGDAIVQGAVTIDGELATRGTVKFHPVDGGPTAYGEIMNDGTYCLRVGQGKKGDLDESKIYSGEYIASVVVTTPSSMEKPVGESGPPAPGIRLTAAKYSSKETSDLVFQVKAGRNVFPLELDAASTEDLEPQQQDYITEVTEAPAADEQETVESETPAAEQAEPEETTGPDEPEAKSAPEPKPTEEEST